MVAAPSNLTLWTRPETQAARKQEPSFSNRAFQSLWENSIDGLTMTDENGIFVNVNKSYCRIVGKSREELIGQPFYIVWGGEERAQRLQEAYKQRFAANKLETYVERRLILWSGIRIDIEVSGSFVQSDDGQKFLLTIVRNITRRKQAEISIRKNEKRYHDIFEHAVQGMFQSTPEGKLVTANSALLKLLGYASVEELASVDLKSLYVNPDDRKLLGELMQAKGYCANIELQLKKKDGKVITVLEHSRAIKNEFGEIVEYEGALENITIRKALEKKLEQYVSALKASQESLKALNGEKDKLFSILSHDLRSPFSSIIGFSNILLKERETLSEQEQIEFLGYILQAAQQQLSLVNKLLDWSRFETGRVNVEMKVVQLETVVEHSINSIRGVAKQKGIALSSTLRNGVVMRGDEHLLTQVFSNLLCNALKFTPRAGTITVDLVEETKDAWIIGVTDSGMGIPEGDLKKLFKIEEKYTRTGLDGEAGTGLGLPIVAEIVQKHSGIITVTSEEGKGTTFFVQFPKYSSAENIKILIVDDEGLARAVHSRYVKRAFPSATIMCAMDGKEALELTQTFRPTVIISDYAMPEMDGFEFINAFKKLDAVRSIPVIVVTGEDSAASKGALLLAGAAAVINKPITLEALQKALQDILSKTS